MSVVMDKDELTPEWFNENINHGSGTILGVHLTTMDIGAMCRMVRAELDWDVPGASPTSVIVKFPAADAGTLGLARAMRMYELETRFYRDLQPMMGRLSAPVCFLAEIDPEADRFTLVLEDLSASTRPGDVLTESSGQECADVLSELAHLQTASWESSAMQTMSWLADTARTVQIFDSIPHGLEPFLARFGDAISPEHVRLFERVIPKAGEWIRSWSGPSVVQHGDLRTDNVLFGTTSTAPAATLIDFQTVRLGPPGIDPAYFLGSSLAVETRRSSERELVDEYHAQLVSGGVTGFGADDCFKAYRLGALYAVFLFCGLSVQVASSPRVDQVIADQTRRYADMAIDLESAQLAGIA